MKKRALVLGLAKSGLSAVRHLLSSGWEVAGTDRALNRGLRWPETDPLSACELIEETDMARLLNYLKSCHRLIISPGISTDHPLAVKARELSICLQSELELGAEAICHHQSAQALIAVTGSNGKTTTVNWLAHILENCGHKVITAGNIGTPLSSCIKGDASRIIIVEVSSFQLQTMQLALFDAAVLTNITPNHLDRHGDFFKYAKTKCKLQQLLSEKDRFIVSQGIDENFSHLLQKPYQTFGRRTIDTISYIDGKILCDGGKFNVENLLKDHWSHDVDNFCAAFALAHELKISPEDILKAAISFKRPVHRLEWVCRCQGVDYFNDSKATSPDAVVKAIESLNRPVILIAGGVDKSLGFKAPLLPIHKQVEQILLIGQSADAIFKELEGHFSMRKCATLNDAVQHAVSVATPGQAVLLSPGCSSFDMFENYEDRGRQFVALVNRLTHKFEAQ